MTESELFEELAQPGILVVDFYADWCAPCRQFLKIFDTAKEMLSNTSARLIKVDTEALSDVAQIYNIRSIPTFIYFKDGQEVSRHSGIKPMLEMVKIAQTI